MTQPILVTGSAGGRQGATGRHITEALLKQGKPVRAFVRKFDERAEELRKLGAEVVQGDLLNIASVREALKGVKRAYFTYPVDDGLLEATAIFAKAAQEAKTELVVNNSQLRSNPSTPPSYRNMQHRLADEVFDWANVGAVHINAPPYYENLRTLITRSVTEKDTIFLPWGKGDAVYPLTSGSDVAATAIAILAASGLPDKKHYELIGETLTVREIANLLGKVLGRTINYVEITDEQWAEGAKQRIGPHALNHLSHLWKYFRTSDIRREDWGKTKAMPITGNALQTLEQFIKINAEAFGGIHSTHATGKN